MKVAILGSGVVGLAVGLGLSKLGNPVVFYDIDQTKVSQLAVAGLQATSNMEKAVEGTDVFFICVPTPLSDKKLDLHYIETVVTNLATYLKSSQGYHLVVVKSTVLPTTTQNFVIPLLEKISGKKVGQDLGVCVNPEFLTEINQTWTTDSAAFSRGFFNEDRIVIGEYDTQSGDILKKLYEPLQAPTIRTNLKTAEMIKYACNCALASRISYWNEIFHICNQAGIDSNLVASTAAMDNRIGKYGTVHGKAFGGKCLPKDLGALIQFSDSVGYEASLLKAVQEVNFKISSVQGIRE